MGVDSFVLGATHRLKGGTFLGGLSSSLRGLLPTSSPLLPTLVFFQGRI
jgi:hypothetical protein